MLKKKLFIFHIFYSVQFSSVAQSCPTLRPYGLQHARFPCPSPNPRAYSNSCPSSWWCHPTISSSVITFSSCLHLSRHQGLNESAPCIKWPKYWSFSFSIRTDAEHQHQEHPGLISFRWTGWISLQPKGLSGVFSNTTVQKHQFFSTQLSL